MNEFEPYPESSMMPDFSQMVSKRLETNKNVSPSTGFDPHKLMIQRKELNSGEIVDITNVQQWPEKDVKALEEFCSKYGIIGFNCGRMHPIAALAMLKKNLGVGNALGENIPIGYEKMETKFGPNYPYSSAVSSNQKILLKG